jgi:hypothetical protein
MSAILIVWYGLMAGLLWSVFCRLVRTTRNTLLVVRASIFFLGAVGLVGVAAPLYGWRPDFMHMAITVACLNMQIVAARHWRNGVPSPFQREPMPASARY